MTADLLAALRERVQRFETGRNDEGDTYYRAATDRSWLLGRLDDRAAIDRALDPNMGEPEWLVDCGIASCPFRGVEHIGHGMSMARPAPDTALREALAEYGITTDADFREAVGSGGILNGRLVAGTLDVERLREAVWEANKNECWGDAVDTTDAMAAAIAREYAALAPEEPDHE